jgi:hypothetical protein
MNTKLISLRFALAVAAGFAAIDLQAQVDATATLSGVLVGSTYDYTLTVHNTGTLPIEALWYGWIPGFLDLPSTPTTALSASGWSNTVVGTSIQFQGFAGNAIAAGGSGTFTFDSTSTPTAMTTGSNGGAPTGDSVAYAGTVNASAASPDFQPTLAAVPEPSTFGLIIAGSLGLVATGWRRFRVC